MASVTLQIVAGSCNYNRLSLISRGRNGERSLSFMDPICLATCALREKLTVARTDMAPAYRRRLASLGIRPGAVVSVLSATAGGGRVLAVGTSRIALDKAMLNSLYVLPTSA